MNRDETIALWSECQEAKRSALEAGDAYDVAQKKAAETWNAWAEPLRLSLVQKGGGSDVEKAIASVDFSYTYFAEHHNDLDMSEQNTLYVDAFGFNASGFIFPCTANFSSVTFDIQANFNKTTFSGDTYFNLSKFNSPAYFNSATFFGAASFDRAVFTGNALFDKATFSGNTMFFNAEFSSEAWFNDAIISGRAWFTAMKCQSIFVVDRAMFSTVPDLILARFPEPPQLDHILVTAPPLWSSKADPDHPAAFRALKRMAIAAHDRDREMEFFAGEMRAARFVSDYPIPWTKGWASSGRFWVGMAYDVFSDFGRSMVRPLLCWLATVLLAAGFYLGQANDSGRCANRDLRTSPPVEALQLALRNGLIVLYSGDESAHRIHGCLYGMVGKTETPYVPASVSTVTAVQKFFSLLFIFLIGLALRNMLKMK